MITIAAWLATYLIHSTILLVAALIISRFITNQRACEVLWKAALLGGFVTSLVPTITGFTPFARTWSVSDGAAEVSPSTTATTEAGPVVTSVVRQPPAASSGAQLVPPANPNHTSFFVQPGGTQALIAVWTLVALMLIARLLFHHRRILRALRGRQQVADGPLPGMLAELRRKAAVWTPVRLSASDACPTPIALGRSEICVPSRFETDLEIDQQRNALAHELAHLKRNDPLWQMTAGVIESVFFFQPLNIVARRKLRDAAEYLADDWAVQQTSSPLALARCLTQISSWVGTAPVPDGMLAMAEGGSPLVNRIERLAEWKRASSLPARVTVVAALAFVALVATSAPIFSAVPPGQNEILASITVFSEKRNVSPDSVIRYSGPAGSLNERFAWALSQNVNRPHWIGWKSQAAPLSGNFSAASSTLHLEFGANSAPMLSTLVRDAADEQQAGILVRVPGRTAREAEIDAVAFLPMRKTVWLGGDPVMWLGAADVRESLSLLERLRKSSRNPDMRSELAAAYAIHSDPNLVIPGIRMLLEGEGSSDVRSEAIQWLARMHGGDSRTVDLLKDAAMRGNDQDSRVEATDGLRLAMNEGSTRARAALMDLADNARDMRVRSEAMQALYRNKPNK
ncbi:MAG TPA: M56 family metallopeptidase [Gemmatimonadaceae bacterium]|nr:M56 family metallopeptidase [Gemmatimonadaceae bacterium]